MITRLSLGLLLLPFSLGAQTSPDVIGYTSGQAPASAVVLIIPADFIAVEVKIRNDEDDWNTRMDAIAAARETLEKAVAAAGFKLDANRPFSFRESFKGSGSASSFSFFSYSAEPSMQPSSVVRILVPANLTGDTLDSIRKIKALIGGLKISKKTAVTMGDIRLALNNPESFRPRLLQAIANHISETRSVLGSRENSVTELDNAIILTQLDENTIGLFLPFKASYHHAPHNAAIAP